MEYELEAEIRKNLVCAYCGGKSQKVCYNCLENIIAELRQHIDEIRQEIEEIKRKIKD